MYQQQSCIGRKTRWVDFFGSTYITRAIYFVAHYFLLHFNGFDRHPIVLENKKLTIQSSSQCSQTRQCYEDMQRIHNSKEKVI